MLTIYAQAHWADLIKVLMYNILFIYKNNNYIEEKLTEKNKIKGGNPIIESYQLQLLFMYIFG